MNWTLVIHGGAGRITRDVIGDAADRGARAGLARALEAGAAVLAAGGAAVDAVEAAVRVLEDDPHFNAGRGAVLTADGTVELDAAIMDGATRAAGAVAGVTVPKNPVALAHAVMRYGRHVLLAGEGADRFAIEQEVEQAAPDWHALPERREQLAELLAEGDAFDAGMKYGTVGAVARDAAGHLAAATSTGGVTGKRWRRIGDSPVPGAGTWADDRAAAVSCTGSGEVFLRVGAGHEVAGRVRHLGEPIPQAVEAVLEEVVALGGTGGMIAVAPDGTPTWAFSTPGMYRGRATAAGERLVAIYAGE
jgi:L-asparaginase / beta-aspartyl-peptidase